MQTEGSDRERGNPWKDDVERSWLTTWVGELRRRLNQTLDYLRRDSGS